ncbi:MAG: DUF1559 domain-containing protein, partial [Planctomycetales bacterium]|nr:DUF1559 domain-containing protein [Planctomycetales bacterium]
REAARNTQCKNHLKQIGLALHTYHDALGSFPPGWLDTSYNIPSSPPDNGFGWAAFILAQMDQVPLHDRIDFSEPINQSPGNANFVANQYLEIYRCASDNGPDTTNNLPPSPGLPQAVDNYVACFGKKQICENCSDTGRSDGAFAHNSSTRLSDIKDGTSSTFLVGERAWVGANTFGDAYWAGTPDNWALDILGSAGFPMNGNNSARFSSFHPGGANFVFCDGSVRFLSETIDSDPVLVGTYQKLATISGGEVVGRY